MLSASGEFRRRVSDGARTYVRAKIVFASGEERDLDGGDFMENSMTFSQMTSSEGSFDVGAAIVGSFRCILNNFDQQFEDCDFTGARILPQVGVEVDGDIEWLRKGTYWIEQPSSYSGTISLQCEDSMSLMDVPCEEAGTTYPATAATIVSDICDHCGVTLLSKGFSGASTVFSCAPSGCTCRDVLSYVAQATGNWCRMTADNRLELDWYDPTVFDDECWLDGGEFDDGTPYETGDDADGGDFTDYSSGASYDGGPFLRERVASIWAVASIDVCTDDVVVTGVRVTASDEVRDDGSRGDDGETYLAGSEGYVIDVSGNPLIGFGEARETAERIAARTVGLLFRPMDVSAIGDPRVQPGDAAVLVDRHNTARRTYLTGVTYKTGAYAAYRCSAETPSRNSSAAAGAVTKALKKADEALRQERGARELALERFRDDIASSAGMYTTEETDGGSTVWYVHDKPSLAESQFVWKMSAAGFGMSIDGGKTYQYGLDKWGSAILNSIYAEGIDADYITTGSLRVRRDGETMFCADMNTGQFWWSAAYSSLSDDGSLRVSRGNIGLFAIDATSIKYIRSSLTSRTEGVYLGKDGISTGNGLYWSALSNGSFFGGYESNVEAGYVCFGVPQSGSSDGATYIGGKGGVYICAPKLGVRGSWAPRTNADARFLYQGVTGAHQFATGVKSNLSLSVTWGTLSNVAICDASGKVTGRYTSVRYPTAITIKGGIDTTLKTVHFTQGLMTSV